MLLVGDIQEHVRALTEAIRNLDDLSLARSIYSRPDVQASLSAAQKYALFSELQAEYTQTLSAFDTWPALKNALMVQYPA